MFYKCDPHESNICFTQRSCQRCGFSGPNPTIENQKLWSLGRAQQTKLFHVFQVAFSHLKSKHHCSKPHNTVVIGMGTGPIGLYVSIISQYLVELFENGEEAWSRWRRCVPGSGSEASNVSCYSTAHCLLLVRCTCSAAVPAAMSAPFLPHFPKMMMDS